MTARTDAAYRARGCTDYGGGYLDRPTEYALYHAAMEACACAILSLPEPASEEQILEAVRAVENALPDEPWKRGAGTVETSITSRDYGQTYVVDRIGRERGL